MNHNYGKLENGRLVYFDGTLRDGDTYIIAPTAADFRCFGWLPVIDERPTDPASEGYYWERTGWAISPDGKSVIAQYHLIPDPQPPPRTFSKINMEAAVFKRGLLAKLDAFVDAQTITNEMGDTMPLRRAYNTAQTFREDHPLFAPYLAAAKMALGVDDATADEILAEAETED